MDAPVLFTVGMLGMHIGAVRSSSFYLPSLARISFPLDLKRMVGNIKGNLCYGHTLEVESVCISAKAYCCGKQC